MQARQIKINDLRITPVDPHSPIPLYHQIHIDLKSLLQTGKIPPGSILPPELEICRAYGVGRQTVRMAIAGLVDENLVERFAGRGTFVKSQSERMKFYLDRSFTQQMIELGYEPRSRLLHVSTGTVDRSCPEPLHEHLGSPCLKLVRLRFGNHEPISIQSATILTELCPGLFRHDFNSGSLYEILSKEYKLVISEIRHVVKAVAAGDDQADLLQMPVGAPLLFVSTTAFMENKQIIECTDSYYRGDRYEYSTTDTYRE